jgi:amino acid transporter
LRRWIVGQPRELEDPHVLRHVSLIAFLAWVGLGADGLSSSAYGPEEAYRALGEHSMLAPILALMTALTVAVISLAYASVIEHFPGGGGGYLVATKLLGARAGVISGCALLVDYVLTIAISVASACDQLWSLLPVGWGQYKLPAALVLVSGLILLNLRGTRESVKVLAPIFLLFIGTHAAMILWVVVSRWGGVDEIGAGAAGELRQSVSTLGWWPVALILLRAYSLGGGTYTGIEAVSNGVGSLREPRVRTGKRTMGLMAVSLAFTAGGILIGYVLTGIRPVEGRTMNASLFMDLFGDLTLGGLAVGWWFVVASLFAEAALLVVAAQTGFLDGPRVLANMAVDSWMPHRFAALSDRLVAKNGVFLMGLAAAGALLYTGAGIGTLVVMYAINVFLTFALTQLGMARHWVLERRREARWKSQLLIQAVGLTLCSGILVVTVYEKFGHGGWVTLVLTGAAIAVAFWVRRHYRSVQHQLRRLDQLLMTLPQGSDRPATPAPLDRAAPTAVICVASYSGFGLHQVLSIERLFPRHYKSYVFVSAAIVDSGVFKGSAELEGVQSEAEETVRRYVEWARSRGFQAEGRTALGTEAVETVEELCRGLAKEFPRAVFFMGRLIFQRERWHHRLLHNETAHAIERRLHFQGLQAIVLPIRVLEEAA